MPNIKPNGGGHYFWWWPEQLSFSRHMTISSSSSSLSILIIIINMVDNIMFNILGSWQWLDGNAYFITSSVCVCVYHLLIAYSISLPLSMLLFQFGCRFLSLFFCWPIEFCQRFDDGGFPICFPYCFIVGWVVAEIVQTSTIQTQQFGKAKTRQLSWRRQAL